MSMTVCFYCYGDSCYDDVTYCVCMTVCYYCYGDNCYDDVTYCV